MTHLRKMMLEELQRRNYSQSTTTTYIRTVEDFARYFKCAPDQLGQEHIREYQAQLFSKRKLAPNTVTQRLVALRFFFVRTLNKPWSTNETPYPKKVVRLPAILSQEEVARLIDAAHILFHRVVLMALYATGVRRAELAHLKISDIDSQCMVIHVQGGKGRKDRDVMLNPKLLEVLREHLAWSEAKARRVAVSRQSLALRQSQDGYQGALASVPDGCPAGGYPKGSLPAHFAPLLRHLERGCLVPRCPKIHRSRTLGGLVPAGRLAAPDRCGLLTLVRHVRPAARSRRLMIRTRSVVPPNTPLKSVPEQWTWVTRLLYSTWRRRQRAQREGYQSSVGLRNRSRR
jgi:integrase/recombinase XerD